MRRGPLIFDIYIFLDCAKAFSAIKGVANIKTGRTYTISDLSCRVKDSRGFVVGAFSVSVSIYSNISTPERVLTHYQYYFQLK